MRGTCAGVLPPASGLHDDTEELRYVFRLVARNIDDDPILYNFAKLGHYYGSKQIARAREILNQESHLLHSCGLRSPLLVAGEQIEPSVGSWLHQLSGRYRGAYRTFAKAS